MFLIQLLLPSQESGDSRVAATRAELVERFGGITAYTQTPAHGEWTDASGRREADTVVMVEIVAAVFDRAWWTRYTDTLARRFDQQALHVRALRVELLDPDAA